MTGKLGGVGGVKGRREEEGREGGRGEEEGGGGKGDVKGRGGEERREKRGGERRGEGVISPSLRCSLILKILPHAPNIALLFLT